MPSDEAPGTEGPVNTTQFKAFVGGLSFQMNNSDLKNAFSRFDATDAEVMMDRHTGRPRGFGFVYFKDEQGLQEAIAEMHDKDLEGRRISVVKAVPQDQTKPGTPAAVLGAGPGARRDYAPRRDAGAPRGGYDRYEARGYSGYDRGGGYDRYAGYADPRYAYDRGGYDSRYGYGYDRPDPYRDAYRGGYGGYGGYGYDERAYGAYSGYERGYDDRYDDRGAGGPERRGYSASARAAPYERPPVDRRPPEAPRR